jgi:hypothetical protein
VRQEKAENRLNLPDDDEDIVSRVLSFLYTGDYEEESLNAVTSAFETEQVFETHMVTFLTQAKIEVATPLMAEDDMTQKQSGELHNTETDADKAPNWEEQMKIVTTLEKNAQVYVCADKLGIDKLKKHAATKFKQRLWSVTDAKHAYPALCLAYEHTNQDDPGLRSEAMRYSISKVSRVQNFPRLVALLKEHEPITWECAVDLQHESFEERVIRWQEQKLLAKDKERAERQLLHTQEELKSVVQLVNGERFMSGSRCKNADMKLISRINRLGTRQYALFCKCCEKWHFGVYITCAREEGGDVV